jgi:hypothetical protein
VIWIIGFKQIETDFEESKFKGTTVQENATKLTQQIKGFEKKLRYEFPKAIDKALQLLEKIEDDSQVWEDSLVEIKTLAKDECTSYIDEARRVMDRFDSTVSSIRGRINKSLNEAADHRNEGDFSQSLKKTKQARDKLMKHLEQAQGSSVRIEMLLLSKSNLSYNELTTTYEEQFGETFDEETSKELIRLLREGRLRGTFSI